MEKKDLEQEFRRPKKTSRKKLKQIHEPCTVRNKGNPGYHR